MVSSIIDIDLEDNIIFTIQNIGNIRDEDEYGGYRIDILFQFENIRESLILDIATGDPVTPSAINYQYKVMLEDNCVNVWTYNMETIIAEKIESIFSKLELSSRMKDYYDIYLIYTKEWEHINLEHLRNAISNTFRKRNFNQNLFVSLEIIRDSQILKTRWISFARKKDYAINVSYEDIMECLNEIIKVINPQD